MYKMESRALQWTPLKLALLTSSLLSEEISLCIWGRGLPAAAPASLVFLESMTADVANCSNAFSKPVMAWWAAGGFFGFLCFFLSTSSAEQACVASSMSWSGQREEG